LFAGSSNKLPKPKSPAWLYLPSLLPQVIITHSMQSLPDFPDPPDYKTIQSCTGKMLVARGKGLPAHGEPWHLVQVTEPVETGNIDEVPILAFEVLFLTPGKRENSSYIFTDAENELVGAMYCTTFISPTGATCMRSLFSSMDVPAETDPEQNPEGES